MVEASYRCDNCGKERLESEGEPLVSPPGYHSPDGLPTMTCPKCVANNGGERGGNRD